MPFSHNGLKLLQVFSQVNRYTLSYRFLYGSVQGCAFAKDRPVSLNWTDYTCRLSSYNVHLPIMLESERQAVYKEGKKERKKERKKE